MIGLGVIFIVSLLLSAFFSGTEMAFVSANKLKLREMAESGNRRARYILELHRKPQYFLAAILIGNNVVNVTAISICTYAFREFLGWGSEWAATAVMAPVLIVAAEMLPKDYCRLTAVPFLVANAFWLKSLQRVLHGPIHILFMIMDLFWPALKQQEKRDIFVNEEEFRSLIDESTRRGVVGAQEEKLIHTILDFERIQVHAVMTPVGKVPKVDIRGKVGDAKRIAREKHVRMILVYEEIPSIVVGMIYVFDILWEEDDAKGLHDFLRAPIFIPENTSIEKAFLTLQQKHQSYAVVTDRSGDVKGIVPVENLLILDKR
ncbi:MAG: DUF21 domain-containing protein [Candidatus Omnitrophica bacterium]|nr:DUF21 domain-containing protein [Candidatus Omnitrophota bacterium]